MGLFSAIKDAQVRTRIDDEVFYSEALREIESGIRRDGLWGKALADAKGDEKLVRSLYIDLLVRVLRDERYAEEKIQNNIERQQQSLLDQRLRADAELHHQEEIRKGEERQRIYEALGVRAKRIAWRSVIPAWVIGVLFFLLLGSEIGIALGMATIFFAPTAGFLIFLVASLVLRGVRL